MKQKTLSRDEAHLIIGRLAHSITVRRVLAVAVVDNDGVLVDRQFADGEEECAYVAHRRAYTASISGLPLDRMHRHLLFAIPAHRRGRMSHLFDPQDIGGSPILRQGRMVGAVGVVARLCDQRLAGAIARSWRAILPQPTDSERLLRRPAAYADTGANWVNHPGKNNCLDLSRPETSVIPYRPEPLCLRIP